jgi:hypothetical protein
MFRITAFPCIVLFFVFGTCMSLAQGFYVTVNGGYGLGAATQILDVTYNNTGSTGAYEVVPGSFGEGFKFGGSAGYMFNENLGVEVVLSYWLGKRFEASLQTSTFSEAINRRGSGFVANPSIVLSSDMKGLHPYARIGVVLGILRISEDFTYNDPGSTYKYTEEENGGLAFGYAGALGVAVPTGGLVDLFAELDIHAFTYSPHQVEVAGYTVNGMNQLETLSSRVREFKESFTEGMTNVIPAVRRPFSSVGVVVGARIKL